YSAAPGFDGAMYIDLFEVNYPKSFRFSSENLSANLGGKDTTSKLFRIAGYNPSNDINIYDVNNNFRISNVTSNSDTLKFTGKSNGKFELVNNYITKKPFRIKQKQVPDLVSSNNGADYIVVYNNLFVSQAEQLRAYRQSHDNYRSVKSDIEDIYDIFNYGFENPIAIKNFVKHIYDNWQSPKLSYICLFGRGSLDPKKNSSSSVYYNNLIPVYGNPPSDGYFANLNSGSFFYYDQISIGRLPAYNVSEAQAIVDKILAYENEVPARWWKTFTFITGGSSLDEQLIFQQRSNSDINNYITSPPISGEAVKIYRNDSTGNISFNYMDSIKNTINRGSIFVNYRGHAGSHGWDLGLEDPGVLNNGNKLPMVLSLTSHTGENSITENRGFGEKFIYLNNKGAIGFVGTTGLSFSGAGNNFGTYIQQTLSVDSTRRLGDFLKYAGLKMSIDSPSFSVRHTINCYNLLGDPAAKLKLPRFPEFQITNSDYEISNEAVNISDPITLTIFPKNFGLYADSCKIRFQLKKYNQNYSYHDTVYRAFKFLDTVLYNFKIDSNGVYNMTVTLDQDNWYPFEDETNNSITFSIPVKTTSFIPLSPVNNSIVFNDSVEFSVLNPNFSFNQKTIKVTLELDTSKQFNSPVKRTFVNNNLSGTVTKFKTGLASLTNNLLYYWRTNSIINDDTSAWSKIQIFIYNNGIVRSDDKDRYINESIPVVLSKRNPNQFSQPDFENTKFSNDGIKLIEYPANLFVKSLGSNGEETSYFTVGDKNLFIDGGSNAGLNLLKVKRLNGSISQFKNLKMNSVSSSDSLVDFLNTFDSTYYMMLLNAAYVQGGTTLSASAKNKLRQFGSTYCDSIGLLGYFHSWSLIGYLGAIPSQASEMFDPCCRPAPACIACDHWTASISSMNVTFTKSTGTVSNIIGPAQVWTDFSWKQTLMPNSTLVFDVIGINSDGQQTILLSNLKTDKFVDLSEINAFQYPKLNLLAKFNIDTLTGTLSAALNALNVNYSPASELVLDKNSLQIISEQKDNSITNFSFDYHNAGFAYLYGITVNVYSESNLLLTDTVNSLLKIDSTKSYSNSFIAPGFRDSTRIYIYIKPKGNYTEFYTYNNSADFKLSSTKSNEIASSKVEVSSDGKIIANGDYVRKTPEIKINLTKNISSQLKQILSDTTQIVLKLNESYVPYFNNGKLNSLIKTVENNFKDNQGSENEISLFYYPELINGNNKLSIIYKDEENVIDNMDTISYDVFVSDELIVQDFYNYPNPMKDETNFIFNIAGSVSPERFRIRIYSVSGRLIRDIDYPANIGYNRILWDGKDNDGDYVANGTYFYKLITQNESNSGNIESQVQKLVVLK
ncbi:MAG: C25 family cysteine peptidase, partial [bacterium]